MGDERSQFVRFVGVAISLLLLNSMDSKAAQIDPCAKRPANDRLSKAIGYEWATTHSVYLKSMVDAGHEASLPKNLNIISVDSACVFGTRAIDFEIVFKDGRADRDRYYLKRSDDGTWRVTNGSDPVGTTVKR